MQCLQLKGRGFFAWVFMCFFRPPFQAEVYVHSLQMNGFSPEWIRLWLVRREAELDEKTHILHLWFFSPFLSFVLCSLLWSIKPFLVLKVLSHELQGMVIPSIWFASMWFFIALLMPSFPHTLQMLHFLFWGLSVMLFSSDSTIFSSVSNSLGTLLGISNIASLLTPRIFKSVFWNTDFWKVLQSCDFFVDRAMVLQTFERFVCLFCHKPLLRLSSTMASCLYVVVHFLCHLTLGTWLKEDWGKIARMIKCLSYQKSESVPKVIFEYLLSST